MSEANLVSLAVKVVNPKVPIVERILTLKYIRPIVARRIAQDPHKLAKHLNLVLYECRDDKADVDDPPSSFTGKDLVDWFLRETSQKEGEDIHSWLRRASALIRAVSSIYASESRVDALVEAIASAMEGY